MLDILNSRFGEILHSMFLPHHQIPRMAVRRPQSWSIRAFALILSSDGKTTQFNGGHRAEPLSLARLCVEWASDRPRNETIHFNTASMDRDLSCHQHLACFSIALSRISNSDDWLVHIAKLFNTKAGITASWSAR